MDKHLTFNARNYIKVGVIFFGGVLTTVGRCFSEGKFGVYLSTLINSCKGGIT